jgi:hypothetical protein
MIEPGPRACRELCTEAVILWSAGVRPADRQQSKRGETGVAIPLPGVRMKFATQLTAELGNVIKACRVIGYSCQQF